MSILKLKSNRNLFFVLFLIFLVSIYYVYFSNSANSDSSKKKEKAKDVSSQKVDDKDELIFTFVDDVMIPVPSEIFTILDKLSSPEWGLFVLKCKFNYSRNRDQISLLLGVTVAEGFLAVQNKNSDKVEEIGKEVLGMSRILGFEQEVKSHCQIILDAAKGGEWEVIKQEFDKTQRSVENAMRALGDESLSQLVSIGGWLRGLNIATDVVNQSYSEEKSELINQQEMVEHFKSKVSKILDKKVVSSDKKLSDGINKKVLKEIKVLLESINKYMGDGVAAPKKEGIISINKECHSFIKRICDNEI